MPGYILVEQSQLIPARQEGIRPFLEVYGILDFLRELSEDDVSFKRLSEIRIVGLEAILFAARPADRELALIIHQRLQHAAGDLQRKLLTVQVVFNGKLERGAALWSTFRNERLPIDYIFDSPLQQTDSRGNHFYPVTFHLSTPSP
jgi:hypothetical protein